MSAHNHDEELIKQTIKKPSQKVGEKLIKQTIKKPSQKVGEKLQKKADDMKDELVRNALLNADIKGLSRDKAKAKLNNIVDEILGE